MPSLTDGSSKKTFAAEVSDWFDTLPEDGLDWAEALLSAALEQTRDYTQTLALAKSEYAKDPVGAGSEQVSGEGPTNRLKGMT